MQYLTGEVDIHFIFNTERKISEHTICVGSFGALWMELL